MSLGGFGISLVQKEDTESQEGVGRVDGLGVDLLPNRQSPLQKPFGLRVSALKACRFREANQAQGSLRSFRIELFADRKSLLPPFLRFVSLAPLQRHFAEADQTVPYLAASRINLFEERKLPPKEALSGVVIAALIGDVAQVMKCFCQGHAVGLEFFKDVPGAEESGLGACEIATGIEHVAVGHKAWGDGIS